MASHDRVQRVADLVKQEIAEMLLHGEVKDPRIGFVTITGVKMSPDLKEARVYFSQIGSDEEKKKSLDGLRSAGAYVRRALSRRLDLRHIPSVTFYFDESLEYSEHIEKVLRDLKRGDAE